MKINGTNSIPFLGKSDRSEKGSLNWKNSLSENKKDGEVFRSN